MRLVSSCVKWSGSWRAIHFGRPRACISSPPSSVSNMSEHAAKWTFSELLSILVFYLQVHTERKILLFS